MTKKKELHTCELCGEKDETVMIWVGGYLTYAHGTCAEIANRGIEQYFRYLLVDFNGLELLMKDLTKALEQIEGKRKE